MAERRLTAETRSGSQGIRGGGPETVRVRLLGGFSASVGSRTIHHDEWRLRKAAALMKVLALAPGHRLHREQAMDLLWPDSGKKAASNNLRYTLHVLRKTLATNPAAGFRYLASEDESLVMCPNGELWVDVEAFEKAAATGRRAQDPAAYRAALDLYGGELLPGDRYENWAEGRREVLQQLYLALLVELAGLYEERGEYGPAIEVLHKVVMVEPTSEEAHVGLMRLYACSGHQAEALQQYERLRSTLRRELGTEPDLATRRLSQDIEAGSFAQTRAAPADPSPEELRDANKHNLPAMRSSFVGREREMQEVKRELSMTRLLTLTGVGGSGKTRLALKVTRELVGAYPDGAWLVELASLSEGALVPQVVAGALGVHEQPSQPLTDALAEALRTKQMLLVMDNCEHLIDAVAHLADVLLDSCPRLRILTTSREALGIAGESVWLVPPLSVPQQNHAPTVEELEGYESVRLLMERARRRNLAFALTSENVEAVAEICRRLEGLPLAIELAAARVGLSAQQLAARLGETLKLLTGGSRIAVPRQQTLRGALDWSYELLSERAQTPFRRLSVFAGGWTLAAAEVVGSGEGIEAADVLDLLSGLVDKSLVVAEAREGSRVRYRMLEPIRQYAREKLEASREAKETLRCHAEFFLALAEEAEPGVEGPQQAAWLDQLEMEHDNLRAALSWSLEQGEDTNRGLRMGTALGDFWYLRGYLGEGRRWLEKTLAKSSRAPTAARARTLQRVSWLAFQQGDLSRAKRASEEGLELEGVDLLRTGGGNSVAAELQITLGLILNSQGEFETATALFNRSLALSREADSVKGVATSLFRLGMEWRFAGDFERATKFLEEALTLCRGSGDPALTASILTHLGYTFLYQGNLERATAVSEEAVAMLREQKHRLYLANSLNTLGWVTLLQGDPERAKVLYAEGLILRREVGNKVVVEESLGGLACAAGARGEAERAARLFGAAEGLREMIGTQQESGEWPLQEPYLTGARSEIDEVSWETAFAEGQGMTFEEAVEYALSAEEPAKNAPSAPGQHSTHEPPALTRREREVASLVAQGLTNRQIASELVLSKHTVHHHVTNILKKLNLRSREQVASRLSDW